MSFVRDLFKRSIEYGNRIAIQNRNGQSFTYNEISNRSKGIAGSLQSTFGKDNLQGKRVGFLCQPGEDYVSTQWGIWRAGGCGVPLCVSHPKSEMEYVLEDCGVEVVVADKVYQEIGESLSSKFLSSDSDSKYIEPSVLFDEEDPAMLVYTSGTTGKPKGVVTRHLSLGAQVRDQIEMWGWTKNDRAINCLPLHHVHGIVNLNLVPLYSGACVEFLEPKPDRLWERFRLRDLPGGSITTFMAVPTIYSKLIQEYEKMPKQLQEQSSASMKDLRLMVSGSAALPTTVMKKWKDITGHTLLERYGMTEMAMALSNPLSPESERYPGYVGLPMPSAQVKIVDEETGDVIEPNSGKSGLLCVRGLIVFKEYWNKPEATKKEFDSDGWFKTGDIAAYNPEKNSYKILGRASADIIKSGGYKLSALEIERKILEYADIKEIAIVGIPDETYGQVVGAVIVLKDPTKLENFKTWMQQNLTLYKIPRTILQLESEIPKNAMGKVNKKQLLKELF